MSLYHSTASDGNRDDWVQAARQRRIEDVAAQLGLKLRRQGKELVGPCPTCGGDDRFAINTVKQIFNCRGCGAAGDVIALVQHVLGTDFTAACEFLAGMPAPPTNRDEPMRPFGSRGENGATKNSAPTATARRPETDLAKQEFLAAKAAATPIAVATYEYQDESGATLFRTRRMEWRNADGSYVLRRGKHYKEFRQERPGPNGEWIRNLEGIRRVLYRLPELIRAVANGETVFVVEGEAKVDQLHSWGLAATCSPMGAGKWQDEYRPFLAGANVVVLPDNDGPGLTHTGEVAVSLKDVARSIKLLELPNLPAAGDVIDWHRSGGTAEEFKRLAEEAPEAEFEEVQQPEAHNGGTDAEAVPLIPLNEIDAGDDPGPIPPRGWLLGNQFCRKFLSSLFATGGTGKTALRMAQYLALATGHTLTGEHVYKRSRVLLLSFEDDQDELNRRLAAALIHHKITRSEIKGWFFTAAPKGLKLAETRHGSPQIGQLERTLRDAISRRNPDLIGLDPFIKLHALEENDNGAMDFVCDLLTQLAIEFDIAIDAPHHTRKGILTGGDADTGRGASSIKDAGRLIYTLTAMSEDEAEMFGIGEMERRSYVRLDNAKINIVPPSQKTTWFKLVNVSIGNATELYPNGDNIQTVECWSPPETWSDLPNSVLNTVLTAIDAGLGDGQRYSNAGNARDRAAWTVVQRHCPNKTEGQCREIINTWVRNGVLYKDDYDDPIRRTKCSGLRLDTSKRPG